jgi:hypothetical protein
MMGQNNLGLRSSTPSADEEEPPFCEVKHTKNKSTIVSHTLIYFCLGIN